MLDGLPPDGTPWPEATAAVSAVLHETFEALESWCAHPHLDRRPPAGWSGREVLEHVHQVDHYLFLLADKLARKSAGRAARGEAWPAREACFSVLAALTEGAWPHPEHMTPRGGVAAEQLAADLAGDRARAEALLAGATAGEATLHTIRFSVVDARLDLVQVLAFVAVHGRRHLRQLERLHPAGY